MDPVPVVRFSGVCKSYRLGQERLNLRAALPGHFGRAVRADAFRALDNISLHVSAGEALGIVGHNGAGKSTVLKLAARVVAPTRGRVETRGRCTSLIELGVGFHPDLTGAQNIEFAGAILGMSRRDIASRYDQIVEFAGVGAFINTPVKRYSSGMLARLGFALAAHVDSEVVMIDEVLGVGDAEFQRRSYQRLRELRDSGAAVLLVSHALWVIAESCDRAVRLDHGKIVDEGEPGGVVERYRTAGPRPSSEGGPSAHFEHLSVTPARCVAPTGLEVEARIRLPELPESAFWHLSFGRPDGLVLAGWTSPPRTGSAGEHTIAVMTDPLPVPPGRYRVWLSLLSDDGGPIVHASGSADVVVEGSDRPSHLYGFVDVPASWNVRPNDGHGTLAS